MLNIKNKLCSDANKGEIIAVNLLLDVYPDIFSRIEYNFLMNARHDDLIEMIPNNINMYDTYALKSYALNGNYACVKILLEKGADIHACKDYILSKISEYAENISDTNYSQNNYSQILELLNYE